MIPVSKKRLLTTTVGVILAVAIIFTSYTLGNNMAKYQLYSDIENNPYQISFVGSGNFTGILKSYSEIENLSNVRQTLLDLWVDGVYTNNFTFENSTIHMNRGLSVHYFKGYKIKLLEGRMPENDSEALAIQYTFNEFEWNIGDKIEINYYTHAGELYWTNYTIVGVAAVKEPLGQQSEGQYWEGIIITSHAMKSLGKENLEYNAGFRVSISPDYLLSSSDYKEVEKKVNDIKYQVQNIIVSNGVYYRAAGYEETYNYAGVFTLLFAVFYSLPVIVMGAYLSMVGIEIEFLERRREFGILKIRGATAKELSKMILVEATIYAVIGGIIGYLLGELLAYLSNVLFFKLPYFTLDFGIWPLVGALILSVSLFLIAVYSPWKKIKKEPIINLISHYTQSFKSAEYNKKNRDIILSIIFWGYMILTLWISRTINPYGGLNILVIIAYILIGTIGFMFPIILIVLPLVMSRLLTMGTAKVYKFIASGIAKAFKTSGELAEKGIERSPKRAAYLAFILAFILTLSSFIAVAMDNYQYSSEIERQAMVGGDMLIDVYANKVPWDILNDTSKVSKYVIIYQSNSTIRDGAPLYEVDMRKYIDTIYNGNLFLKDGKLDGTGVVISYSYAMSSNLNVGDIAGVPVNDTIQYYRVEAIMYSFPGLPTDYVLDKNNPVGVPNYIIVRTNNIKALEKSLDEKGYTYTLPPKEDNMSIAQAQFMNTLLVYLVILGAASIFIVQYSSLLNRRGEIALYKVRGARNRQISAMLMTEGITIIILSLIIGVAVGVALAYMLFSMVSMSSYRPELFVIGTTFLIYTGILILAYAISQYILSHIFARTKPSEVIRGLGGEI